MATAALAAGAVASQSISWGLGSDTSAVIGQQVLLKPTKQVTQTPTPVCIMFGGVAP